MLVAATLAAPLLAAPAPASAEGLFDFFFGGMQQQRPQREVPQQANSYADPFTGQPNPAAQYVPPTRAAAAGGSGPAFCVRSCDGKYFPLMRGLTSPAQMCQAFCPATATKVYFGSSIDGAASQTGERYADSENAFAYRKALRAAEQEVEQAFGRDRGRSREQRSCKGGGHKHRATPPARMGQDCTQRSLHPTLLNRLGPRGSQHMIHHKAGW